MPNNHPHQARTILDFPLPPAAFEQRARELLRALRSLDLGDVLIQARQPHSWIGSRAGDWERLRDEFRSWTADPDSRLAEVGRRGVALYEDLLRAETDGA